MVFEPPALFVDPRKIRDYLLDPDHPQGRGKAGFFFGLGFTRERPWELAHELKRLAASAEAIMVVRSPYGTKHVVDGRLRGMRVRTVWIVKPGRADATFVTAYPLRRDK